MQTTDWNLSRSTQSCWKGSGGIEGEEGRVRRCIFREEGVLGTGFFFQMEGGVAEDAGMDWACLR